MVTFRHVRISDKDNTTSIELNDFNGYLMTSPTGFGIYRISEYINIGNQRVSVSNYPQFNKIKFNVDIFGKRYEQEERYAKLRDFISTHMKQGFRLYYNPLNEERYINCDILIVDKSEKQNAYLPIAIEVQPKSLWLTDVKKQSLQQTISSGNLFEFHNNIVNNEEYYGATLSIYDDILDEFDENYYGFAFPSGNSNIVIINNIGQEQTSALIRIYGEAVNPIISLFKHSTGELNQIIRFDNLVIEEGYYLEINSSVENPYIHLVNERTGERFDREGFADINSNIYITLPIGLWDMTISDENGSSTMHTDVFYTNQYYGG